MWSTTDVSRAARRCAPHDAPAGRTAGTSRGSPGGTRPPGRCEPVRRPQRTTRPCGGTSGTGLRSRSSSTWSVADRAAALRDDRIVAGLDPSGQLVVVPLDHGVDPRHVRRDPSGAHLPTYWGRVPTARASRPARSPASSSSAARRTPRSKLMAACVLAEGRYVLRNVPRISDVDDMCALLDAMGISSRWREDGALEIVRGAEVTPEAPYELVERMRASSAVLGPLLAAMGRGQRGDAGRRRLRLAADRHAPAGTRGARCHVHPEPRRDRGSSRRADRDRGGARVPQRRAPPRTC